MGQWPKFLKIPKKPMQCDPKQSLSFYISFLLIFFSFWWWTNKSRNKKLCIWCEEKYLYIFIRNAQGIQWQIFSAAATAGSLTVPHGRAQTTLHFTPANRNLTPPLSGDSLRVGLMSPLPIILRTRHEVSPARTGVCHLPGLFSSLEEHGRFTPTSCPVRVVVN